MDEKDLRNLIDDVKAGRLTRRAFVQTMIGLGRSLGLETVAEWVQDEQTAAMLAGWGCDYLQGDLVGRATLERPWANITPPESAAR